MKRFFILTIVIFACLALSSVLAAETTYTGKMDYILINAEGEHTITLAGVTIDGDASWYDPYNDWWYEDMHPGIEVKTPATKLTIILKDGTTNVVNGGYGFANDFNSGIENNGVTIVIRCEHAGNGHKCTDSCGVLNVTGGTQAAGIGSSHNDIISDMSGHIIIEGGNIIAAGRDTGAGIGGCEDGKMTGTITINGGNITAIGKEGAAGIGSGDSEWDMTGDIYINGGNVTAIGGEKGTGIGAGGFCTRMEGNIVITGGTIVATGGNSAAGIGASNQGKLSGSVTISGGNVTANGGSAGAGIGTGILFGLIDGNITISGGVVTATGGSNAAGIGTGLNGNLEGNIIISGGSVTATGGENGAGIGYGIGNGADKDTGAIIIRNGTVVANGGQNGAGIGIGKGSVFIGDITIEDGIVAANGGENASGIGFARYALEENGKLIVKGGIVTVNAGSEDMRAIASAAIDGTADHDYIYVDPITGYIEVKEGDDADSAAELEGSPYGAKKELSALFAGKSYAQFRPGTPHFCSGGTATCINLAVCDGCGKTYGELNANNHVHKIVLPAVPATTTSTGLTEGLKCFDCDTVIIPQEVVPMLPVSELPHTGDNMNFALFAIIAVFSLTVMMGIIRKKNET